MNKNNLYLSTIDDHAQDLAKQQGLGLEIAEFSTAWNLDDSFAQTDAIVRSKLDCSDRFTMHGPYSELFPCAIDRKVRALAADRYRQTIQTALQYDIHKIVFHAGFNPWLYFPCWFTEQSILFWKEFVRDIPDGVELVLENVLEEQPEQLAEIIRAVDSPKLRMCLDVGHAHAYSKAPVLTWVSECRDIIDHFHIHNNDSTWDTHSPLDCGTIPMARVLSAISELCPDATVTLELMDGASSLDWLRKEGILEE